MLLLLLGSECAHKLRDESFVTHIFRIWLSLYRGSRDPLQHVQTIVTRVYLNDFRIIHSREIHLRHLRQIHFRIFSFPYSFQAVNINCGFNQNTKSVNLWLLVNPNQYGLNRSKTQNTLEVRWRQLESVQTIFRYNSMLGKASKLDKNWPSYGISRPGKTTWRPPAILIRVKYSNVSKNYVNFAGDEFSVNEMFRKPYLTR